MEPCLSWLYLTILHQQVVLPGSTFDEKYADDIRILLRAIGELESSKELSGALQPPGGPVTDID